MQNLHTKYEIIELKKEDVQVLNSSAIASGYAGRDPQGGFAMEAVSYTHLTLPTIYSV